MKFTLSRINKWLPTREQLESSRLLRPFAQKILRPELWRFNRRSVPRGVALGLFVGVIIPVAHFAVVPFLAVFVRANIPVAMLATFIGFPVIYVGLVAMAYKIGEWLLHVDPIIVIEPVNATIQGTGVGSFFQQFTGKALATAFGLFVEATVFAVIGYVVTSLVWPLWVARKRKAKLRHLDRLYSE